MWLTKKEPPPGCSCPKPKGVHEHVWGNWSQKKGKGQTITKVTNNYTPTATYGYGTGVTEYSTGIVAYQERQCKECGYVEQQSMNFLQETK